MLTSHFGSTGFGRPNRARRGIATAVIVAGVMAQAFAGSVAAANVDHFALAITGTTTAGVNLALTVTAQDSSNRASKGYDGVECVAFGGLGDSPNGTHPSYPAQGVCAAGQSAVTFNKGVATPAVKPFLAGAGNVLTVSDPALLVSGSSAGFTVKAGPAAHLAFLAQPIDTKVGTPIFTTCVPDPVRPCALAPASTAVAVQETDAYGNNGADKVAILGVQVSPNASGVASFGNSLVINALGSAALRASASATVFVDSAGFQIVNDLKACSGQSCKNSTDNGAKNVQRAVNTISTSTGDFFAGGANVRLSTSFYNQAGECGQTTAVGQGTEARVEGTLGATTPTTTMLIIIPKRSLQGFGVSSRNADSFEVCVGSIRLDGGTTPWKALGAGGTLIDATQVGDTFWGTVADCATPGLDASNPCAAVKSKNVGDIVAYYNSIGDSATAASIPSLMANSDLAIVLHKGYPWDGKGGVYY